MKQTSTFLIPILLVLLIGCGRNKQSNNDLIIVDVSKSYPKKEMILQDFMDVEYIALETTDEFLTQGEILAIGNKYILVKNQVDDGDIFIFDRKTGEGLRKINRKGQGAEEYIRIDAATMDEDNDELFINCDTSGKIFVYDLSGSFKRDLSHGDENEYLDIFNYDSENLIRYDNGRNKGIQSYHAIISKQDGSITLDIPIPLDKIKIPILHVGGGIAFTNVSSIIPYEDNWILVETSSDTVYQYLSKENKLTPFLVKIPSSTDPEIFLTMGSFTDRFYFMQTIEMVWDPTTVKGFPTTDLMYDKHENAIFNVSVLNDDYLKKEVNMTSNPINGKITSYHTLAADDLVEAYAEGLLKGKLNEIAAELEEEDNAVLMLIKDNK